MIMEIITAKDMATRFVDQDALTKTDIWESENIGADEEIVIQLTNVERSTYVDVVSYPSDTVFAMRRVPIDDIDKIAHAILDVCEEAGILVDRTCVTTFVGKKSGQTITLQRYGDDDYGAWFRDDADYSNPLAGYSVRGTLLQILDEIKEEV